VRHSNDADAGGQSFQRPKKLFFSCLTTSNPSLSRAETDSIGNRRNCGALEISDTLFDSHCALTLTASEERLEIPVVAATVIAMK